MYMSQYDGGMVSQLGLGASFISIFGSLYIYFVSEDQLLGVFVVVESGFVIDGWVGHLRFVLYLLSSIRSDVRRVV